MMKFYFLLLVMLLLPDVASARPLRIYPFLNTTACYNTTNPFNGTYFSGPFFYNVTFPGGNHVNGTYLNHTMHGGANTSHSTAGPGEQVKAETPLWVLFQVVVPIIAIVALYNLCCVVLYWLINKNPLKAEKEEEVRRERTVMQTYFTSIISVEAES